MKLTSILSNHQRLDGGAMFGNAPKALWTRWTAPDDRNRIRLACRTLLIETDGQRILLEAGIGAFFDPKQRDRFGVEESDHMLLKNLASLGLEHSDIDAVVLSHLHFDHAGGLLSAYEQGQNPTLLFPNATFFVGARHWQRATNPHYRDRASFLPDLNQQLEQSGRLVLVDGQSHPDLGPRFRFHYSDGHTPGLMLTEVNTSSLDKPAPLVFAADLIPGVPWVNLPITMGYDRFPEKLIEEKQALLTDLHERGGRLFFTHDPDVAAASLGINSKGRFEAIGHQTELPESQS